MGLLCTSRSVGGAEAVPVDQLDEAAGGRDGSSSETGVAPAAPPARAARDVGGARGAPRQARLRTWRGRCEPNGWEEDPLRSEEFLMDVPLTLRRAILRMSLSIYMVGR